MELRTGRKNQGLVRKILNVDFFRKNKYDIRDSNFALEVKNQSK